MVDNGLSVGADGKIEWGGLLHQPTTIQGNGNALTIHSALTHATGSTIYLDNGSALLKTVDTTGAAGGGAVARIQTIDGYTAQIDAQTILINEFPSTRDDTGSFTPVNFLYTDAAGDLQSSPIGCLKAPTVQTIAATAAFTIGSKDLLLVNAAGGNVTVTLNHPAVGTCAGLTIIKRIDTVAGNTVTVTAASGLIDGLASWAMNTNGSDLPALTFYSDGTNFYLV